MEREKEEQDIVVYRPKVEEVEENLLEDAPAELNRYEQQIDALKSNLKSLGIDEVRDLPSVTVSKKETV